ncbi:MAG: NAD(P)/FAD-dependent oxidoreductase [Propionibacteriales bacterium]|nr:NAD(P)/FAD-dependent oxidoreductase [Propionibacteriales bacterium]
MAHRAQDGGRPPAEVDVVVLGLGPAGRGAALDLAEAGLEVVGIDKHLVGGECPFYGCTPTKMMVRAAELLAEARRVGGMAGTSTVEPSWVPVAERIADEATDDWDDQEAVDALTAAGVWVVRGHGRLAGSRRVAVGDETFRARRGVLLGTGTEPGVPPIDGLARTPYWTNRDIVKVTDLPETLIVIGGGAIGVELCQVLARFGVTVTLLEAADRILAQGEPEASALITEVFGSEGIRVLAGADIERVDYADGQFTVAVDGHRMSAEKLLVTAGRKNNLGDVGLETVGLDPDLDVIETDSQMRAADGLWAAGDITGRGAYTHIAHYQAEIATRAIIDCPDGPAADYRAVPNVTFTDPEVGSVGMTEERARDDGRTVRTGAADLSQSPRGWVHSRGNQGFVKVVEDADDQVLVGATVAGPMGGELLAYLTLAIHARVPTATLESMIYAFPTFHETIKSALADLQPSS